ncbi:OmpA family protein [Aliiroseovarius sp. PTFE2010]|uniref:OmpA family protein n=1 Tax=Aliiroseovarius sp. PTFE2010 TaxID=3417190 RepID=UPI003CF49071
MQAHIKIFFGAASLIALTACDRGALDSWNSPAGAFLDEGSFGNPTMNNTLVMTGQRDYIINLNQRFASEVPSTVNFEFNKATLTPQAMATLRQQADWIRQFPEVHFKVFGHTDLVGSNAYNKALGMRRARAAVNYLISQGISRSRLEAVVSYGETQPLVATQEPEMRNRRTVTEVAGFVKSHPAVLNGKYAQVVFREYVNSARPDSDLVEFGVSKTE